MQPHTIYPMIHQGLGAAEDQLGLWEVDWEKLEELGPEIYNAALMGPIQGAMMGMDNETINSVLRIFLQTYGVPEMYKRLMALWPFDVEKFEAEKNHLMGRSMAMYQYYIDLTHQFEEARKNLVANLAAGIELDAEDFHKSALAAGWSQAQIDQALAEGKKLYTIKPKKKTASTLWLLVLVAAMLYFTTKS